jgi:hypothetical protein
LSNTGSRRVPDDPRSDAITLTQTHTPAALSPVPEGHATAGDLRAR